MIQRQLFPPSQPQPLFEKEELPLPQQHNRRIIQIIELPFPKPKLLPHPQVSLHPQFVAVKSLISDLLEFLFTIYGMRMANKGYKNIDFMDGNR